jgi:hypothetical protein
MEFNTDSKVKNWYEQLMQDSKSDEYLFQSYSWETPLDSQPKSEINQKLKSDNCFDLNFEDSDFKFYFPNLEASKQPVLDQAVVLEKPFSLDDSQDIAEIQRVAAVKTGSEACSSTSNNMGDSQHTEYSHPRKDSDMEVAKPVSASNSSTKDNETDSKSENAVHQEMTSKNDKTDENFVPEMDTLKPEDDPDFYYKAPRKQKFEYNKRKDVILKTILRKCRRTLQDKFNDMTGYFPKKKTHGSQFLKDCIMQFHESLEGKPEKLDLVFYLTAILYPQEMSRGVDCFFEADKNERVKFRKVYRAKIQKVHDVLYRYSHEKMDYFTSVPELCYLYTIFYKEEMKKSDEDIFYMNGATEIFQKCHQTLCDKGITF